MREYYNRYRQASGAIKLFIWTVISMAAVMIYTTVWPYVRLKTSRTHIPEIRADVKSWKPNSLDK